MNQKAIRTIHNGWEMWTIPHDQGYDKECMEMLLYWPENGKTVCQFGIFHREDGPALIAPDGTERWYTNGLRHRVGGPAITTLVPNGYRYQWFENDIPHRTDGPADISPTDIYYYNMGKLHRTDGPAYVEVGRAERWFLHGELHRIGAPAIVYADGQQEWCAHGVPHRTDGPAFVSGKRVQYFLFGRKSSKREIDSYDPDKCKLLTELQVSMLLGRNIKFAR